jgi:hypothetical protein
MLISGVDKKVGSLNESLSTKIENLGETLSTKIDNLGQTLNTKIDKLIERTYIIYVVLAIIGAATVPSILPL